MIEFRVWFSTSCRPYSYFITQEAPNAEVVHRTWKDDPDFLGISRTDSPKVPLVAQEQREHDANHL